MCGSGFYSTIAQWPICVILVKLIYKGLLKNMECIFQVQPTLDQFWVATQVSGGGGGGAQSGKG